MKDKMKISIIVPYYNMDERVINRCIKSIRKQTFEDYEVILINDGSDKRYECVLDRISKYDKFRVISTKHQGVSAARNSGTSMADGEYITYVDADDCIAPDYLWHTYEVIKETDADVVFTGVKLADENESEHADKTGKIRQTYKLCDEDMICMLKRHMTDQSVREFTNFDDHSYFGRGCYARLIKKELAQTISFPDDIRIGEDIIWHNCLLRSAHKVVLLFEGSYFYLRNGNSVTRSWNSGFVSDRADLIYRIFGITGLNQATYNLIWQQYWGIVTVYAESAKNLLRHERNRFIRDLLKREPWNYIVKNRKYASGYVTCMTVLVRTGFIFDYLKFYQHIFVPLKKYMRKILMN